MALVWIPALLRDLTDGQSQVKVQGTTVRQVIDNLESEHPGVKARLCRGGALIPYLAVYVDGRRASLGMSQPVEDQSEVHFMPAVGGG